MIAPVGLQAQPTGQGWAKPVMDRLAALSIGQRLLALVLAVALPLNLVIFVVIWQLTDASREAQRAALEYSARAAGAAINSELEKYAALIEALGHSPALLESDLTAFESEARRQFSTDTNAWVIVADLDGRPLLDTSLAKLPPAPSFRPPAAMEAQRQAMASHALTLSDLTLDPTKGVGIATLELPIAKNGKPFRVLAIALTSRLFQQALASQPMPQSWLSGIIDGEGHYVARVPSGETLAGQLASAGWRATRHVQGWAEFKSREGDPVLNFNTHLKFGDWSAAIGAKKSMFETAAWRTTRWAMLFGGLLSLSSLLLAVLLGRNIARPIATLQSEVTRLGTGPSAGSSDPPEISALRTAIETAGAERERHEARLRMLIGVTSKLIEAHERDELGRIVFEGVGPLLDADVCLKYRLDADGDNLSLAYAAGLSPDDRAEAQTLAVGEAMCGSVAKHRESLTADAQLIAVDPRAGMLRRLGARAFSCHLLRSRDGKVLGTFSVASRVRDSFTTDDVSLLSTLTNVLSQAVERLLAERSVQQSHDTFRHLVDHSPFGIYIVDSDFKLARVSEGAKKVFENISPLIGRDFSEILHFLWPDPFASEAIDHFRHTLATGEPYHAIRTVQERNDIEAVEAYDWKIERIAMPDGRLGVVCHFYDLSQRLRQETELRISNERQSVLMRELAHRGKNLLAVVQAIARRSFTGQRASTEDRDAFLGRLQALANTFAGFTETAAVASPLRDIVLGAIKTFVDRVDVSGPAILVDARAAQTFALIVHELATNATKYGALSVPTGKLAIRWQADAASERFSFVWTETGGPPAKLDKSGFGTVLVTQIAGAELGCKPSIEATPDGLIYRIDTALGAVGEIRDASTWLVTSAS